MQRCGSPSQCGVAFEFYETPTLLRVGVWALFFIALLMYLRVRLSPVRAEAAHQPHVGSFGLFLQGMQTELLRFLTSHSHKELALLVGDDRTPRRKLLAVAAQSRH